MNSAFRTVALVGRYQSEGVAGTLADIAAMLAGRGIRVLLESETADALECPHAERATIDEIGAMYTERDRAITERLRHVPIIMITSRTGQKHQNRAMAIGVNDYLGKPYQESVLLERIAYWSNFHA